MTKTYLGISAFSHNAAVALIQGNEILFASESERYSRVKNDKELNDEVIEEALKYGTPDEIIFYENPLLKRTRQFCAGQFGLAFSVDTLRSRLRRFKALEGIPIKTCSHHLSHAAAGAYTSSFTDACVVVIDAIGEWDCITIWDWDLVGGFKKLHSIKYPHSLGLLYTAMTQRCGLKPNEDEYILMGMAAYGQPVLEPNMRSMFFKGGSLCEMQTNFHRGLSKYELGASEYDIAASAQLVIEEKVTEIIRFSKTLSKSKNLVYMGGVALNCVANSKIHDIYHNTWIMPAPGDSGSAIGCAAYANGRSLNWKGPYLGHEIVGDYPIYHALGAIGRGEIFGIANGRAEFGPRALGNRSLMADPRGNEIKDRVNEIKHRQKFRPFAPVIMEEHVHDFFDVCTESPYMQYVGTCKYPELFPAICHVDNSSRIQTVNKEQHPGLYNLLEIFYTAQGCPMLLNTSLNIKGEPIVNDPADALRFSKKYGVPIYISD